MPSPLILSVLVALLAHGPTLVAQAPAVPTPTPVAPTPAAGPRQLPKVIGGPPAIPVPTTGGEAPANPAPAVGSTALPALAIPSAATNDPAAPAPGTAVAPAVAEGTPAVPAPANVPAAAATTTTTATATSTATAPVVTNLPATAPRTPLPVAATPTNAPGTRPLALPSNFPRPATNVAATSRPGLPVAGPAAPRPGPAGRPGVPAAAPAAAPISAETEENNALVDRLKSITDLEEYSEAIKIKGMPLDQFLDIYAKAAKRIVLRGQGLNGQLQVTFVADKKLPREVVLQAFDTVLALNQIATVPQGEEFVLVVPSQTAAGMGKQFSTNAAAGYNEAFQYVTHIVHVKHAEVKEAVEVMAKFASPQNAQGIVALESTKTIVLRDYQANVKRMLEVLEKIDVHVEDDFQLEVIPIKYGKVEEIYGTLSSVIGGGGGGYSGGASLNANRRNTTRSSSVRSSSSYGTGAGAFGGVGNTGGFNSQQNNLNAAGGRTGTGFQQRLAGVNRGGAAGGAPGAGGAISELLETTSITPDPRSNSLIVYGTKKDITKLKEVISKVDTLLAQVLIEGIIMEVSLTDGLNYGLSAGQNPKNFGGNPNVVGGGSVNGNSALNNVSSFLGGGNGGTNGTFSTGGGLSYFTKIGPTWNLALNAIASDDRVNIIQRPRIQTTHATEARFFVGSTVAFQQGAYGGISGVSSSYYQRQDVGIDLTVTPYITPDGLVTMEVNQVIEEIAPGSSTDSAVPPTTNKREANSTVSVMSGEAILLGGYIRNSRSGGHSGVPFLKDIPLLGKAFSSTKRNDARTELMVLVRPTVLLNPKDAAEYATKTRQDSAPLRELENEIQASEKARREAVEKKEKRRDSKWWGH